MRISSLLAHLLGFSLARSYVDDPDAGGGGDAAAAAAAAARAANPPRESFSREYVSEIREEAKSWRVKFQERDVALKEASEKLTVAEKAAQEAGTKAEQAANERVMRAELKAVALKHGVVDMDLLKLMDLSAVKLLENGDIEGADALFEAAKKSKPHFFGAVSTSSTAKTPPVGDPKVTDARKQTPEEYAASKAAYLKANK